MFFNENLHFNESFYPSSQLVWCFFKKNNNIHRENHLLPDQPMLQNWLQELSDYKTFDGMRTNNDKDTLLFCFQLSRFYFNVQLCLSVNHLVMTRLHVCLHVTVVEITFSYILTNTLCIIYKDKKCHAKSFKNMLHELYMKFFELSPISFKIYCTMVDGGT